jgi:hypothetical protein
LTRPARGGAVRPRAAVLVLLLAAAACAPVYEPSFRLNMPQPLDTTARQCFANCVTTREACFVPAREAHAQCSEHANLVQNQCRANAQIDYQICQSAYGPEGQICVPAICQRPRCTADALDLCEADYRRCFAGCGGRVVEERRCVANCPS